MTVCKFVSAVLQPKMEVVSVVDANRVIDLATHVRTLLKQHMQVLVIQQELRNPKRSTTTRVHFFANFVGNYLKIANVCIEQHGPRYHCFDQVLGDDGMTYGISIRHMRLRNNEPAELLAQQCQCISRGNVERSDHLFGSNVKLMRC